jgi:hypothetical protein
LRRTFPHFPLLAFACEPVPGDRQLQALGRAPAKSGAKVSLIVCSFERLAVQPQSLTHRGEKSFEGVQVLVRSRASLDAADRCLVSGGLQRQASLADPSPFGFA